MVKDIIQIKKDFFKTGKTRYISYRIQLLENFKNTLLKYEKEILGSINKDLNRSEFAAYSSEFLAVIEEIDYFIKNIRKLSKVEKRKTPKLYFGYKSYIIREPFGVCLIISPWNYPFLLSLSPLVGAIAAGNVAILKPSEFSENCSLLLKKIIAEAFPREICEVVLGEGEIVQEIIKNKVDFVFFTGSTRVGSLIMEYASKTLTPVALELGGKSPCIIDETADLDMSARRILWGKTLNAGQTCIAPDYLIVKSSVKQKFIEKLIHYTKEFWGENALENPKYPKIINERNFNNVLNLIKDTNVLYGGRYNKDTLQLEPTYVDEPSFEHSIMQQEIFAPLLPILSFDREEEIYSIVEKNEKPLALYIFSKNENFIQKITTSISFGCSCINDTILQTSNFHIPFEGVGTSGMGGYHGEDSFYLFSHNKSIMKAKFAFEADIKYPHKEDLPKLKRMLKFLK